MQANCHPRLAEYVPGQDYTKGDVLAYNNNGFYVDAQHWMVGPPDLLTVKPLTDGSASQPIIVPRLSILHTQAGNVRASNTAAWNYANRADTTGDAHFYGPQMDDGKIINALPLNRRSDSSYKANRFQLPNGDPTWYGAWTFETQDNGANPMDKLNKTPWSLYQLGTIVWCLTAMHFTYKVPCGAVTWALGTGIACHRDFTNDPVYPWSKDAHSCPGNARVGQMDWIRNQVSTNIAKIYADCGESCPV